MLLVEWLLLCRGIPHLSTVGYSHWFTGSRTGSRVSLPVVFVTSCWELKERDGEGIVGVVEFRSRHGANPTVTLERKPPNLALSNPSSE